MISPSIRKERPAGRIFGSGFSWSEAVDAAADIFNGVKALLQGIPVVAMLTSYVVCLLVHADIPRSYCVV